MNATTTERKPLTDIQAKVLAYLVKCVELEDRIPPNHVIAKDFGWASPTAANEHVHAIERKGWLTRTHYGALMLADRPVMAPKVCAWSLDDVDMGTWRSSCGELWSFIDGGPAENRVSFCHHCGGRAYVVKGQEVAHG